MNKVQEVPVLIEKLRSSSVEFIALTPLGEECCDFLFCGPFDGKWVLWQTHLQQGNAGPQEIEIRPGPESDLYHLRIKLNLPRIAQGDILKTMMMIRQYKKLKTGLHTFSS